MRKTRGYTLIEILIVMTILGVLFVIGTANYRDYSRRQAILGVSKNLVSDLRLAQERALSGEKPGGTECDSPNSLEGYSFGVVAANAYKINAVCTGGSVEIKRVCLASGARITAPSQNPFVFKVLGEGTDITDTEAFYVGLYDDPIKITVSSSGEISTEQPSTTIDGLNMPVSDCGDTSSDIELPGSSGSSGGTGTTYVNATFGSDSQGFVYQEPMYGGTSNQYTDGVYESSSSSCQSGGCLKVNLNTGCSDCGPFGGAWRTTFNAPSQDNIKVTFNYTLRLSKNTETGELAKMYYRDIATGSNIEAATIDHDGPPNDEYKYGTVSYIRNGLSGNLTFDVGCYLERVSASNEDANCWIDNVLIQSAGN